MKRLWPIFLALPLLLGGCKQISKQLKIPSSRVRKIAHLDATTNDFELTKEEITVRSRTITSAQECTDIFGRNGKDLLTKRKKIYSIQVTIENKTDKKLVLPRENVGLKTASIRRVLKRVGYWTGMRALMTGGCLLGGVTMLTWVSLPLLPLIIYGPIVLASAALCAGAPFFLGLAILIPSLPIVTMLHSVKSHNANRMISKFVKQTCIVDEVTIEPGQTRSLLFFVRQRSYKRNFFMVFKREDENAILFDVQTVSINKNRSKKEKQQ